MRRLNKLFLTLNIWPKRSKINTSSDQNLNHCLNDIGDGHWSQRR